MEFIIVKGWCRDRVGMLKWALENRDGGEMRSSSDRSASEKAEALEEERKVKAAQEKRKWRRFWK